MNRNDFEGWYGQNQRMLRWHVRLRAVYGERDDAELVYDFIYAFFQNCFQMRDWLVNDEVAEKPELNSLFGKSVELQLCRDICNSSKHKKISRQSIDPTPRIGREWDSSSNTWVGWFLYSDKRREVLGLADQCVSQWQEFLEQKGLLENVA